MLKLPGCLCAAMLSDACMNNIKKIITLILCLCMICCVTGCGDNSSGLISDANLSSSSYKLGDYMGDYTVTDINGNTHTFSDILKDKKAVVLNFWFINCGPCQMEFPYLQTAADTYSDDIAVIAINPVDSKTASIEKYAKQNELTIPMAVGDEAWVTAFGLQGFPTTVVIDRYGSIAFMHTGAVTEDGVFEKIFEFFTADGYKQTTVNSINDIK